jgi:magnesium-transporting ATPase (P-type)
MALVTPPVRPDAPFQRKALDPEGRLHEVLWHSRTADEVRELLRTEPKGLSTDEARQRLEEFGANTLPAPEPPSLLTVFLHQFASPLIYILLIAGGVALAMQDYKDAIFIFAVVLLNAAIGTYQEFRAEKKAHALQVMLKIQAKVLRDGEQVTVSAEDLVPGDVLLLESGGKVPADLRLTSATGLAIDESFLTGESLPVDKRLGVVDEATPVSDRSNMAFAGATVVSGRGTGVAVGTGVQTEVGRIAVSLVTTESAKPPLLIRMEQFAHHISYIVLGFTGLLGSWLVFGRGESAGEVFMQMVAVAVSAIPEGLPVAMTVALSIATARMADRRVIARRLMAVESLGSCTLIASDKTGTLTVNQQTLKRVSLPDGQSVEVGGQGYNDEGEIADPSGESLAADVSSRVLEVARAGALCNEASLEKRDGEWRHAGDAVDVAMLAFARKAGLDPGAEQRRLPLAGEIPFESERRYAAKAYLEGDARLVVVKGAVETVLPLCGSARVAEGEAPLDTRKVLADSEKLAEEGYRVLAVAQGRLEGPGTPETLNPAELTGLSFLGLVSFIDPLRPEVQQAVAEAHGAGVRVLMITGDHPATALAISRELGIAESRVDVVTGSELDQIDPGDESAWAERVRGTRVFARVTPHQKLKIVDVLVGQGEFVAVTGDGVNDAAALRRANIGVAMGSGTDIAKDASLITVMDDNFSSIVAGIEEGRFAYSNVRKVTLLLISTGFAELVLIGASILLGMPMPMVAVQILWLNLVTNGIQDVALAFEAGEKGVMKLPPRPPSEGIFNRKMIEQVMVGGLTMGAVCLGLWIYLIDVAGYEEKQARTLVFTLLVLMQFYHVLNCRSEFRSAFRVPMKNNPILMYGMGLAFLIHVAVVNVPFMQELLRVTALPLRYWFILGGIAAVVIGIMEVYKFVRRADAPQSG